MKELKNLLEHINNERKKLDEAYKDAKKRACVIFNNTAKHYLNESYKIFKLMQSDGEYCYIIANSIESNVFSNQHNKLVLEILNIKGLCLYNRYGSYVLSNISCKPFDNIFTFFDEIEEISIDEFNEVLNLWFDTTEAKWLNDEDSGEEDDDDSFEDWFLDYFMFIKPFVGILNNEKINKEIEKHKNLIEENYGD